MDAGSSASHSGVTGSQQGQVSRYISIPAGGGSLSCLIKVFLLL